MWPLQESTEGDGDPGGEPTPGGENENVGPGHEEDPNLPPGNGGEENPAEGDGETELPGGEEEEQEFPPGTEAETDPTEAETDPAEAETDPTEAETDPTEAETDPTEEEKNPAEAGGHILGLLAGDNTIDLYVPYPPNSGEGWYYASNTNTYHIQNGADVRVRGTSEKYALFLEDGATATLTLENASISPANASPISLGVNARLTLTLEGENSLKAAGGNSGILVPQTGQLTINGSGSLNAEGGSAALTGGAGIGGEGMYVGGITIDSGRVTATGGGSFGVGIGGVGSTITINGGTITAQGGDSGEGIGGIDSYITIKGGNIEARGGVSGVGIGGFGITITINGGTITAQGGDNGAGIGGSPYSAGGNITIHGGNITATGGISAAGIGGGSSGAGGNITIHGGTVMATGGSSIGGFIFGGAGMGGGGNGGGGNITISGGTVTAIAGSDTNCHAIGSGGNATGGTVTVDGHFDYWTNTMNSAPGTAATQGEFDNDSDTFAPSKNYRYIKLAGECTVTFDSRGGSSVDPQTVFPGGKVSRPENDPDSPDGLNGTFVGWYPDTDFITPWEFDVDEVTESMTLYAQWDNIIYVDGEAVKDISVANIEKAINDALDTPGGGTVTVTGKYSSTVPGSITIHIPQGKTLLWEADYSGHATTQATGMIVLKSYSVTRGSGEMVLGGGGSITNSNRTRFVIAIEDNVKLAVDKASGATAVSYTMDSAPASSTIIMYLNSELHLKNGIIVGPIETRNTSTVFITGGTVEHNPTATLGYTIVMSENSALMLSGGEVRNSAKPAEAILLRGNLNNSPFLYLEGGSTVSDDSISLSITDGGLGNPRAVYRDLTDAPKFNDSFQKDANLFQITDHDLTTEGGEPYTYNSPPHPGQITATFMEGLSIDSVKASPATVAQTHSGNTVIFAGQYDEKNITLHITGTLLNGRIPVAFDATIAGGINISTGLPTGKISVMGEEFEAFKSSYTYELFSTTSQPVEIEGEDGFGEPLKKIEYLFTTEAFTTAADAAAARGWWTYDPGHELTLSPGQKGSLHARLIDTYGNASVINTDGIVVYTSATRAGDAPSVSAKILMKRWRWE